MINKLLVGIIIFSALQAYAETPGDVPPVASSPVVVAEAQPDSPPADASSPPSGEAPSTGGASSVDAEKAQAQAPAEKPEETPTPKKQLTSGNPAQDLALVESLIAEKKWDDGIKASDEMLASLTQGDDKARALFLYGIIRSSVEDSLSAQEQFAQSVKLAPSMKVEEEKYPAEAMAMYKKIKASLTGSIAVSSEPDGADIFWGGEKRGVTAATVEPVLAGDYTVKLVKKGYLDAERKISVAGGKRTSLSVDMKLDDRTPPEITFYKGQEAKEGVAYVVHIGAKDNDKVKVALLHFRIKNVGGPFMTLPMNKVSEGNYEAEISGGSIKGDFIQYYLTAEDPSGNIASEKDREHPHEVRIIPSDQEPPVIFHEALRNTTDMSHPSIKAKAVDNSGSVSMLIGMRAEGEKDYTVEKMAPGVENQFSYAVTEVLLKAEGVEYYLEASDPAGNKAFFGRPDSPNYITVLNVLPYAEGLVVDRKKKDGRPGNSVTINLGTTHGIKKDSILTVFIDNDRVTDPANKEVVQVRQAVTGKIKVVTPGLRSSEAVIIKEHDGANRLDINQPVRSRCGKLTNLMGASLKNREVEIHWSRSNEPEAEGYVVYRAESPQGPFTKLETISKVETTFFVDNDSRKGPVVDGKEYYYQVAALNDDRVEGIHSATLPVRTKSGANPPLGFRASSNEPKQVTFNWFKTSDPDAEGYIIQRADDPNGTFADVVKLKGSSDVQTALKVTKELPLEDGKKYYFRILSFNKAGKTGNPSPVVEAFTRPKPPAPTNMKVVRESVKSVGLSWDTYPGRDVEGFTVYRKGKGDAEFKKIGNISKPTATTFSDSGKELVENGKFEYYVTASVKGVGEGVKSEIVSIVIRPLPPAPTGVRATASAGTVSVTWGKSPSEEVVKYNVYIKGPSPETPVGTTGETSLEVTKEISPNKSYTVYVKAVDAAGLESAPSETVKVTTPK